jgi:hypothetical protein
MATEYDLLRSVLIHQTKQREPIARRFFRYLRRRSLALSDITMALVRKGQPVR